METDHLKVIVKLGLEFEYLKPLLFSFHCLMTLILPHWSNWPIYPYSIFHLLKISQNISVKKEKKNTRNMPFVSVSNVKETKKSLPYHPLALSYASEAKVFISNSPWGSKYHLTLSFSYSGKVCFSWPHFTQIKHFLFQQNIIIRGNTSRSSPILQTVLLELENAL